MKTPPSFLYLFLILVALVGCQTEQTLTVVVPEATNTKVISTPSLEPTETQIQPSLTPTNLKPTTTTTLPFPTKIPQPACIKLSYGEYAQTEITSPSGQRIFIDIFDPSKLTSPVTDEDILLTTHTHWDHMNEEFRVNFPGPQLFVQTGTLEASGFLIEGIASVHNQGDRFEPKNGTNYIYLIHANGLRIAHFGDIGQSTLSEEQLSKLSGVDILITQINNPYSDMNAENGKGVGLIKQVNPRLVIPTHLNLDTLKLATSYWNGYFSENASLEICKPDLMKNGTKLLLLGESVETMLKYIELKLWNEP